MRDLNHDLKRLCQRNADGSFATQRDRERILDHIADQLEAMGFQRMNSGSLKPKHVVALCKQWHNEGLAAGSIKNRMSALRWWAEKIGKQNMIRHSNADYGIARRVYVTPISKARILSEGDLSRITDRYTHMSLQLQAAFGLRRGESIKIQPQWADRGHRLLLKSTWTKGGREREIPILTDAQRKVLDEAKWLAQKGSLVEPGNNYVQQLRRFEHQCDIAGISKVHGHRHHYAQMRYQQLTGWAAPAAGGPRTRELTPQQRDTDHLARLQISHELGHYRESVTAIYLGR